MEISGIYKITNTITGDFYIGSSNNIKRRWAAHKKPSALKNNPNNPMYLDMQKYGVDKFVFEILAEVEAVSLKETEQQFIEMFKPSYNNRNANGLNIERYKESNRKASRKYRQSEKGKEHEKSDKRKKMRKEYRNQLCSYNGETLTLHALVLRFMRKGIPNPTAEAKKYLVH